MLLIYFFYYVFRRLYAKTSDLILEMFSYLKENGGCRDDTRHFDFFSFSC